MVEAALRLEREKGRPPTVAEICAAADVDEDVFETHFETADDLRPAFYNLTVDQYRLLAGATTGYEDFTFEERLASFFYILLDALGEQRAFVQKTFDSPVRYRSNFRSEVRRSLRQLVAEEDIPQLNQLVTGLWPVQEVLTEVTFAVIRHWMRDDTNEQAATTALIDKLVAFIAELVTFRGVSRGMDLVWHLVRNDSLGLGRIPVVGRFFSNR